MDTTTVQPTITPSGDVQLGDTLISGDQALALLELLDSNRDIIKEKLRRASLITGLHHAADIASAYPFLAISTVSTDLTDSWDPKVQVTVGSIDDLHRVATIVGARRDAIEVRDSWRKGWERLVLPDGPVRWTFEQPSAESTDTADATDTGQVSA